MLIETKWILNPIEGSSVEKINLPFFYQLGALLNPLTKMQVEPKDRIDFLLAAVNAKATIVELCKMDVGLSVCILSAKALMEAVDQSFDAWKATVSKEKTKDSEDNLDAACKLVIERAKTFETVLSQELPMLSAYYVTQTGIYKTSDLIERAAKDIPEPILDKLNSSIIYEVTQAGRCLAFDVPTACGFHMLRATEAVLHEYYIAVCKPKNQKKLDSWAAYIVSLHKRTEDAKCKAELKEHIARVLALLKQVKNQDRNQIMHPELVLDTNQAHILFKITTTAIMVMADKLHKPKEQNAKA